MATARTFGLVLGPFDLDRYAASMAPANVYVDHRTLGLESAEGRDAVLRVLASVLEVSESVATRIDDVLALSVDALLARWTTFGTARAGGGAYERRLLWLGVVDAGGLVTRFELFDAGREAEALARFDELVAPRPGPRVARRVRSNAATASAARRDAAIRVRDLDALARELDERSEFYDHTSSLRQDRSGLLETYRRQLRTPDLTHRREILATLGHSLALSRREWSGSGAGSRTSDFGPWELDKLTLDQVDAHGRQCWGEWFGGHQLGDAVVRLYERHAELLPEGPERERAAAVARTVAVYAGAMDRDRYMATWSSVSLSSSHGPKSDVREPAPLPDHSLRERARE